MFKQYNVNSLQSCKMGRQIVILVLGYIFVGTESDVQLVLIPQPVIVYNPETLVCTFTGAYVVTGLIWTKDFISVASHIIESDQCIVFKSPDASLYSYNCSVETKTFSLTILNVTRANAGQNWTCGVVINDMILNSKPVSLQIVIPVEAVTMTQPTTDDVTVQENASAVFVCVTSAGLPAATIGWFKDSRTVSRDDVNISAFSSSVTTSTSDNLTSVTSRLVYSPSRVDQGMRVYCTATNGGRSSVESSRRPLLNIQYPPDGPPVIQEGRIFMIMEHEKARLSCSITGGNPLSILTWNCYNGVVSENSSGDTVTKVIMWTASRQQNGSCTCVSSHYSGTQSASISIYVFYNTISSFTLNGVNNNLTITENDTLVLVCTVDSNAETTVTLHHDGRVLPAQTNTRRLEHSIKRVTCPDKGQYTCSATIPYYTKPAKESNMLFIKCKPNPPKEFDNVEDGATDKSLTLQWRTGYDGGIKQTFVLQYRQKGTHIWSTVNLPDDTNTTNDKMHYTINGLASGTRFEVTLYSSNIYGNSELTHIVEAMTTEKNTQDSHYAIIGAAVGGMLGGALFVCFTVAAVVFFQRLRKQKAKESSKPQNSPTDITTNTYMELRQGQELTSPTSLYSTLDLSEDTRGNTAAAEDDKYVNIDLGKEPTKNK